MKIWSLFLMYNSEVDNLIKLLCLLGKHHIHKCRFEALKTSSVIFNVSNDYNAVLYVF